MKPSEIRELSIDELVVRRRELKQETLHLRMQQRSGQLENSARLTLLRKDLARIATILNERRRTAEAAAAANPA